MNRSKRAQCRLVIAAALALGASGCALGPDYVRPDITLPASYKEAPDWKPAEPSDAQPRAPWWQVFGDADLDRLEAHIEVSNQNLRAAAAAYSQALALAAQARASLYPTVGLNAAQTRAHAPQAGGVSAATVTTNTLQLTAAWEIDLWGRIRRGLEASTASADASRADLESTRLSMQALLAQDYFALRLADAQVRLLDETVAADARLLELTRNRYEGGVVTRADVAAAEAQLASARAQHVDSGIVRAQLEHAIAVLIGVAPAQFSLPARELLPAAQELPQIPALLPAQLLERRPDIAAAERRAAAANAEIGVAQAAFFPTLSLAASGGWRGPTLGDLIALPNRVWSLGPTLAAILFDAGAREAATDAAHASFEQSAAQYRQTVLAALQEVEDNLVALRLLADEAQLQREAVRAARQTLDLTTNQYKAGTVNYLNVLIAQTALVNAQLAELGIQNRQLTANVTLIRALGGGWAGEAAT